MTQQRSSVHVPFVFPVQREVFESLKSFDALEEHPTWYVRKQIPVSLESKNIETAWMYFNDTVIDTGVNSMTGGRLKRVGDYLDDEPFFFTYGDGVGDVDIRKSLDVHKSSKRKATMTAVQPPGRFGALHIVGDQITSFQEKQMSFQPDFILEYAHYLGDHFKKDGHKNIEVYVESFVALNGRLSQPYINPNIDLYKQKESFKHKDSSDAQRRRRTRTKSICCSKSKVKTRCIQQVKSCRGKFEQTWSSCSVSRTRGGSSCSRIA